MAALRRMSALSGPHWTPKKQFAHFPALLTRYVVLHCEALEYSMSGVTLCPGCLWSSGGAGSAQVELLRQSWIPQVRLTWTIFSMGLADITSVQEVLLGFVGSWVAAIFYQVSRCASADSVFLKFLVGPKFSIDEGCLTTKLRIFLSISAKAACWMTQTMICWFCCREGNPFEQKKGCFIRLWCWFESPPHEHWLQIE